MYLVQPVINMRFGFCVEGELLYPYIQKLAYKEIRLPDHEVYVKGQLCKLPEPAHRIQTERHAGAEVPVQYVYMEQLCAPCLKFLYRALNAAQVAQGYERG